MMTTLARLDNAATPDPAPPIRAPVPPLIAAAVLTALFVLLIYSIVISAYGYVLWAENAYLEQVRTAAIGQCVEHHRREFDIAVWPPDEMDYQIARCEVILDAAGGVEYPQRQPFSGAGTAGQ